MAPKKSAKVRNDAALEMAAIAEYVNQQPPVEAHPVMASLESMLPPVVVDIAPEDIAGLFDDDKTMDVINIRESAEMDRQAARDYIRMAQQTNERRKENDALVVMAEDDLRFAQDEYDRHHAAVRQAVFASVSAELDALKGHPTYESKKQAVWDRIRTTMMGKFPNVCMTLENAERTFKELKAKSVDLIKEADGYGEKARGLFAKAEIALKEAGFEFESKKDGKAHKS